MKQRVICQVINYGGLGPGSFIPSLVSLAKASRNRGDRFVVLGTDVSGATWPRLLINAGAEVYLNGKFSATVKRLFDIRPDIVHSHFSRFDLAAALSGSSIRVFWHIHSVREPARYSYQSKVRAFLKNRVCSGPVEKIIVPSQFVGREAVEWFAPENKVVTVHNGVDTEHFRLPSKIERISARAELSIEQDDKVVLFFERLPLKGGDLLREALTLCPKLKLIVAGGTERMRSKFGIAPRIISINYAADVRRLYWAADVLAFPSRREAFGFVAAEALMCGLPVAASNISSLVEIFKDSIGVELFASNSARSCADALIRMAGRGRLANFEIDPERYSVSNWTRRIMELYDRSADFSREPALYADSMPI